MFARTGHATTLLHELRRRGLATYIGVGKGVAILVEAP